MRVQSRKHRSMAGREECAISGNSRFGERDVSRLSSEETFHREDGAKESLLIANKVLASFIYDYVEIAPRYAAYSDFRWKPP